MEGTKVCTQCGAEKPFNDYGPNEKKPQGYFNTCHACRMANGSGKNNRWNNETAPAAPAVPCRHSFRLCGDASILQHFPAFYKDHQEADTGEEWQVCKDCGIAKLVRVYEPTGDDKRIERVLAQTREPRAVLAGRDVENGNRPPTEWPKPAPVEGFIADLEKEPGLADEQFAGMKEKTAEWAGQLEAGEMPSPGAARLVQYEDEALRAEAAGLRSDVARQATQISVLQDQLELQTAYAGKWRKRAQKLAEKLELIELRAENEALRRQLAERTSA